MRSPRRLAARIRPAGTTPAPSTRFPPGGLESAHARIFPSPISIPPEARPTPSTPLTARTAGTSAPSRRLRLPCSPSLLLGEPTLPSPERQLARETDDRALRSARQRRRRTLPRDRNPGNDLPPAFVGRGTESTAAGPRISSGFGSIVRRAAFPPASLSDSRPIPRNDSCRDFHPRRAGGGAASHMARLSLRRRPNRLCAS